MLDFHALPHTAQLDVLKALAGKALGHFDLPKDLSFQLINLSENATYKIEAPDGRAWALRIHREGYHPRPAIESELAWLMDLRAKGVAVTPKPVKGRDGEFIQLVLHHSMKMPRHVVLTEWEAGLEPGIGEALEEPFERLGEITAHMHLHARSWVRPSWFQRHIWDFETALGDVNPHWGRWRDGMGVKGETKSLFQGTVDLIGRRLAAYGKSAERFGLIHGDLRLANLLIDGKTVKVLDFDDSGFSWHMYDAAAAVSFYEHEPQVPAFLEAWKKGYRKVSLLPKEDEIEIPTFIMLRRLLLVAWIGSHPETELARSMGLTYTEGTSGLCEAYLSRFT